MARALDPDDLGHTRVMQLSLVGRVGDCPGQCVVQLAGDDEQWSPVDLRSSLVWFACFAIGPPTTDVKPSWSKTTP
jgi:hypothetical protein